MVNTLHVSHASSQSHTIVLLQFTEDENSRTYLDFENLNNSLDGKSH